MHRGGQIRRLSRIAILALAAPITAHADFKGDRTIGRIYGADTIVFGVTNGTDSWNTCTNWYEQFRFDATTPGGQNMLSILMAAKASGGRVDVWFNRSTAPGTNHTNGCTTAAMAEATQVSWK